MTNSTNGILFAAALLAMTSCDRMCSDGAVSSAPEEARPASTSTIDTLVDTYMATKGVDGLSLAITKGGHLVYSKGYGTTGEATPLKPVQAIDSGTLFRIASLSKSVTAVAIMKLYETGAFGAGGLERKVFGAGSIFGSTYAPSGGYGSDLDQIEVLDLLEQSAGFWGPRDPIFFGDGEGVHDPHSFPSSKYEFVASDNPQDWSHDELIRYVVDDVSNNTSLSHSTFYKTAIGGYHYCNFNYCLLGRIVEVLSGQGYEDYVRDEILRPIGITDMHVAGRDWTDLRSDESNYMHSDHVFHRNVARFDSLGGWIASAVDLVKFGTRVEHQVLRSETWDHMLTRESNTSSISYRKGWRVYTGNGRGTELRCAGSMPGTTSILQIEGDLAVAVVMNGQHVDRTQLVYDILDLNTDWDAWSASFTHVDDGDWEVAHTGGSGWSYLGHSGTLLSRMRFADFDGDGTADIFKRDDDGKWYVAYANGGTSGWTYIGYSTSCNLATMAFADFDGDGKCDIFKRDLDGTWSVAYVNGGTNGWNKIGQSTSCDMSTMAFADFNGDGKCDIFKREDDGSWHVAYMGFRTHGWTWLGQSTSCDMSTMRFADFNGDGNCDIFKREDDGDWYVKYVGVGSGGWTWLGQSTSCDLSTMAFADFNGDGKCDIFKRDPDGSWYVAPVNAGLAGWQYWGSSTTATHLLRFADFDGDGKCDIFRKKEDMDGLESSGWNELACSMMPLAKMRFADFDGDGVDDVFLRSSDGKWHVSYTDSIKKGWHYIGYSTSCDLSTMAFADFDGDGDCDIFKRDPDGNWYVAYVDGGTSGWTYIGYSTSCDMSTMRFADFNGDGKCDIFKREDDGGWHVAYSGSGTGWNYIGYSTSCDLSTMAFADFDGDGKCDIFKRDPDGTWYVAYVNGGTSSWSWFGSSSGSAMSELRFHDFDGDGTADVFYKNGSDWQVRLTGTSGWRVIGSSGTALADLRFGDFNGDGKTDLFSYK